MELFKWIEGYEGKYLISTKGNILNVNKGKYIAQHDNTYGYLRVDLLKRIDGKLVRKAERVHCLVLKTFIGERPEGYDIDHIDSNKRNNELCNLRYVTRSENNSKHGTRISYGYKRPVKMIFPDGSTVSFSSITVAAKYLKAYKNLDAKINSLVAEIRKTADKRFSKKTLHGIRYEFIE